MGEDVPWRDRGGSRMQFIAQGYQPAHGEEHPSGQLRYVSPGYFAALGVPILAGRDFNDRDARSGDAPRRSVARRRPLLALLLAGDEVGVATVDQLTKDGLELGFQLRHRLLALGDRVVARDESLDFARLRCDETDADAVADFGNLDRLEHFGKQTPSIERKHCPDALAA